MPAAASFLCRLADADAAGSAGAAAAEPAGAAAATAAGAAQAAERGRPLRKDTSYFCTQRHKTALPSVGVFVVKGRTHVLHHNKSVLAFRGV